MLLRKWILAILSLIIITVVCGASKANMRSNLLEGYVYNPAEFKEREMGKRIVYWYQRKLGEAKVELNYIVFQFDRESQELIDVKMQWREDLPGVLPEVNVTKEKADSMVEGRVDFSQLYFISPESAVFSPVKPTPRGISSLRTSPIIAFTSGRWTVSCQRFAKTRAGPTACSLSKTGTSWPVKEADAG